MSGISACGGDMFGGWVLSQMDIAAGICAGQRAQGRVATIAVDAMTFIAAENFDRAHTDG